MNIIKAERTTVKFCNGVEVDGYRLPSGEFRVGKLGASITVGYAKNYLTEVEKKSPKQLKALQDIGFTGLEEHIELESVKGGGTMASTLSLPDFRKLIIFAASKGKPQAIALGTSTGVDQNLGEVVINTCFKIENRSVVGQRFCR